MKKRQWMAGLALCLCLAACGSLPSTSDGAPAALSSQEAAGTASGWQSISPEEAHDWMKSGEDLVVVDVRTQEEYDAGHIPGAVLVPNEEIGDPVPDQLPEDLDQPLLLYCRSGRRSKEAAEKLAALGYTQVYEFGGIQDWPYEVVQ